jgi:Ca-activated chloride channel family protein
MSTEARYPIAALALVVLLLEAVAALLLLGGWWLLTTEVPSFRLERPELLWGLAAAPLLAVIFLLELGWRNRALRRFGDEATLPRMVPGLSPLRTGARFLLVRHGLGLAVVAAAGPQFGTRMEEVKAEGIDVVVAMDVSNSMSCQDLKPDRMEVARRAMARLIDRLQGDRLGIVVFAGEAYAQLPITSDRAAAKLFLNTIGTHSVGTQGTSIGAAIELAQRSFDPEGGGGRAIIVITDGENHEDDAEGAAQRAAADGIVVHTVGMGTPQGGPIPIKRGREVVGFRKDRAGNTVVTRLDEDMLRRIAAAGGGSYVRATERDSGLEQLVEELRTLEPGSQVATGYRFTAHEDRFQYPLGLAILLITLSFAFAERRQGRPRWLPKAP